MDANGFSSATINDLQSIVVGRSREAELVVAALMGGRHLLLEGPPGTGKSTLLRAIAVSANRGFEFVEGNAELTPARLIGHFDPAMVLDSGYRPDIWIDGPLARALRNGSLLYIEEMNRVPEETLNVLVTVMSEGDLTIPRLGRIKADPGFGLVAAMNPYDAVGTSRVSSAIHDRMCRVLMDYQSAEDEHAIAIRALASTPSADSVSKDGVSIDDIWTSKIVELVRATRSHPEVRVGSSVRGAIDLITMAHQLGRLRATDPTDPAVGLDAALAALTGRIRPADSSRSTPEQIVTELWNTVMAPDQAGKAQSRKAALTTTNR